MTPESESSDAALDFQSVYDEFRVRIRRYLARLGGTADADDLTQETFARVSQALAGFRREAALSTWIYRIATNAALDRLRSPSSRRMVEPALPDGPGPAGAEDQEGEPGTETEARSLEQQLCREERYDCYREYIDGLPPNYRTVVALSELEQLAADEIADILGLSPGVVKTRLHRGRARLLQELKTHCKAEDWL